MDPVNDQFQKPRQLTAMYSSWVVMEVVIVKRVSIEEQTATPTTMHLFLSNYD